MFQVVEWLGRAGMRTFVTALRDIRTNWASVLTVDLIYKAIAFAVLMPLLGLLFQLLIARSGSSALADADIALFFFTTGSGIFTLLFVAALAIAIAAVGQACLMTLGLGRARGIRLRVRDAFVHGAARSFSIICVAGLLVVRVLLIALPFVAVIGAAYWTLLRSHDINYYLTSRPPALWAAVATSGVCIVLLAIAIGRRLVDWILALPIVVFENLSPVLAFGESTRRVEGHRMSATAPLAAWGATWLVLIFVAGKGLQGVGRAIAPAFGASTSGMLLFIGSFEVASFLVFLSIGMLTSALVAQIVVRLYMQAGLTESVKMRRLFHDELEMEGLRVKISWPALMGGLAVTVIAAAFLGHALLKPTWLDRQVLVFAHRGASLEAPENTLASFRLAGEQHTDFVEVDVQESSDGVVLAKHDVDLMRVARSPIRIWESTAAQIRAVDIGSRFSPAFADQRVPTLTEVLALCKGVSRVAVELKDYGHDQQLAERVVALVEAAEMQDQIVTMSLSRLMVEKMKRLRPNWTSGLLAARTIGAPRGLLGDFLAVESGMMTRRFVLSAHAAGKPVYVWTVNNPWDMIRFIGVGADGIITDRPALARGVIASHGEMDEAARLFLFLMTRLGVQEEVL